MTCKKVLQHCHQHSIVFSRPILFFFYFVSQQARVFVTISHFHNQVYCKAGIYLSGAPNQIPLHGQGCKNQTKVELTDIANTLVLSNNLLISKETLINFCVVISFSPNGTNNLNQPKFSQLVIFNYYCKQCMFVHSVKYL